MITGLDENLRHESDRAKYTATNDSLKARSFNVEIPVDFVIIIQTLLSLVIANSANEI